jgi:hypothetical protein
MHTRQIENQLNLIWQTRKGEQTDFEFEYTTQVLFKAFKTSYYFDEGRYEQILDNSVIIYSNDSKKAPPELIHYLNKFKKRNFRFYLLHFSNEGLNHNHWYYSKANYVFRNYFDPQIKASNVLFIPLGFKSGYLNKDGKLNPCGEKTIDVSFVGQPKSDRFEMIEAMEKLDSHYVHKTTSWNSSNALNQEECIDIYQKTKYAPCPMGNVHPDSFRICEALEWGSIPVVRTVNGEDYFKNVFGDHPFRVVNNWNELAAAIKADDYCAEREHVHSWYLDFKAKLQTKITDIITLGGVQDSHPSFLQKELNSEAHRLYNRGRNLLKRIYYKLK